MTLLRHTLYAHTIVQNMSYLKRILRWITTAAYTRIFNACKRYS